MMQNKPEIRGVTQGGDALWSFDVTSLPPNVLGAATGDCYIGKNRILQTYIEAVEFEAYVIIQPNFHRRHGPVIHGNYIEFHRGGNWSSGSRFDTDLWNRPDLGGTGLTLLINVAHIRDYVLQRVGLSKPEFYTPMSIRDASMSVWNDWSRNMKGVIQNWMVKNPPIFLPAEQVERRNPKGARLSLADQVTTGLLYGMFSFGVSYAALQEPIRLRDQ